MNLQFVDKYFARTLFTIATLTILLAFAEAFVQIFGQSLISRFYSPGRLLELAATLLVFVIVQLLRQIRDELRARLRAETEEQ